MVEDTKGEKKNALAPLVFRIPHPFPLNLYAEHSWLAAKGLASAVRLSRMNPIPLPLASLLAGWEAFFDPFRIKRR